MTRRATPREPTAPPLHPAPLARDDPAVKSFAERLLAWHARHGRHDLPWQRDRSPYRVWVSEIMLQQTQVATVVGYFERFMQRFPTVQVLADAPLDAVLHLWSGLGYYARARNLHRAAQVLVAQHAGEFPWTVDEVASLPGIGRSTAGAVLAQARDLRCAILDGNVKRVLTRHRRITGWPDAPAVLKVLWPLAESLTPAVRTAAYTQAIMDLGATLCTRANPRCADCPVRADCAAHRHGEQALYPTPRPKKVLPVRATHFLLLERADGALLLERRPPSGIWGGLWGFPEATERRNVDAVCARLGLAACSATRTLPSVTHAFTHFRLDITPLAIDVVERDDVCMASPDLLWYNAAAPAAVGLAKPVKDLLRRGMIP